MMSFGSHDEEHVQRVVKLAVYIAENEGANLKVVRRAAELHDIGRGSPNHAIVGAKKAKELMEKMGEDGGFIEEVCHCIESHAFSSNIIPRTPEAKVLSDADKIDAIGAVGVARAFLYSGENGRSISDTIKHFDEKLLKLKFETKTGREIAAPRMEFLLRFYEKIKSELYFSRLEE